MDVRIPVLKNKMRTGTSIILRLKSNEALIFYIMRKTRNLYVNLLCPNGHLHK